ncbi:arginine-tRNA-protein transferase [Biscogniauxia mediterranea]|nr:arginine-tRNA-protein transferase [Biscogniauxia mediterranea]
MQATPDDAFSYLSPIGYRSSSSCGYCRRNGSVTGHCYYARAKAMSPVYYQALIDRCWRRSGSLLYKPNQRDACCPHYTLRLDSSKFRASRDQRQAINRFNKYVIGDAYVKEAARRYPKSREQARKRDTEFDLVERIHESESASLKQPPEPAHELVVTLEPDDFTEEKYAVFENYQRIVHQESPSDISRDGFRRFLCSSPLRRESVVTESGEEKQLGSFHHCYRLDGKLVAIGVLDLLPDCVSAVYFLYHESIHKWSPGKLGALREIALAAEGGYRWWYSGFYIHTCPKMRYKIDFSPQQILDPNCLEWVDLTSEILAKFDDHGYLNLSETSKGQDSLQPQGNSPTEVKDQRTDTHGSEDSEGDEEISLFSSNMPGISSIDEISSIDFDSVLIRLNRGFCLAGDLFEWQDEDINVEGGPKRMVAELIAAVGPSLMSSTCLDFRRA